MIDEKNKKEEQSAEDIGTGSEPSANSIVERADAAAERLAKENERLEANLTHLAEVFRDRLGIDVASLPGAGAAGGLGAGLAALASATLEPGVDIVAESVRLNDRLRGADLCITGEGKFDAQSRSGKVAVGVAAIARAASVPVVCVPGQSAPDAPHELLALQHKTHAGELLLHSHHLILERRGFHVPR